MQNNNKKRSEAQKRADKKYHSKTFQAFTVNTKISDYNLIDDFCKKMDISKTQFIVRACKYFIQRGEVPPEDVKK